MIKAIAFVPNSPSLIGNIGVDHEKTVKALESFGRGIEDGVDAVIIMTPHFQTSGGFGIVDTPELKQIFDYYGFPPELYKVKYEPPGDAELGEQLIKLGNENHINIGSVGNWGLDHGAWSPLLHIFKDAAVPVIPISICPDIGAQAHVELGRLMGSSTIKRNLCILASGSLVHRLDLFQRGASEIPPGAREYLETCISAFNEGKWGKIWDADPDILRDASPEGYNLPLRFIQGAVGEKFRATILSNEIEFNAASLTTVKFDEA